MVFENPKKFKDVVIRHAVAVKKDIIFSKIESKKVRVICKAVGYKWMIFASYERNNGNFMVKRCKRNRKCNWTFENTRVTSKVLVEHFIRGR